MVHSSWLRIVFFIVFVLMNCSLSYAGRGSRNASQDWQFLSEQRKQQGRFSEKLDRELFRELGVHQQKRSIKPHKVEPVVEYDAMTYYTENRPCVRSFSPILDLRSSKGKFLATLLLSSSLIYAVQAQETTYSTTVSSSPSPYYTMASECLTQMDPKDSKLDPLDLEEQSAMQLIREGYPKLRTAENKDVVLVVGGTQSGKTTLITRLLGCTMEKSTDGVLDVVVPSCTIPGAIIGTGLESETLYPQVFASNYSKYSYLDCPGFSDSRGDLEGGYNIATAISTQIAVKKANNIKAVLAVISAKDFQSQAAASFKSFTGTLEKIFGNDLEHLPITFVINKGERLTPGAVMVTIKKLITQMQAKPRLMLNSEKAAELNSMLKILQLMNSGNIKIANVFDDSRQNCDEIESAMALASIIPTTSIHFDTHDAFIRFRFNKIMRHMLMEDTNFFQCVGHNIEEMRKAGTFIEANNQAITLYTEKTTRLENGASLDEKSQELKQCEERLRALEDKLEEIREREKELMAEKKKLKTDATPEEYWKDSVREERAYFFGAVSWTRKDFVYDEKVPFSDYEEEVLYSKKLGEFSNRHFDSAAGTYKSTYKSNMGEPGGASVSIRVRRTDLPATKIRLSQVEKDLLREQEDAEQYKLAKEEFKKSCTQISGEVREKQIKDLRRMILDCENKIKEQRNKIKQLIREERKHKPICTDLVHEDGRSWITLDIGNTLEFDPADAAYIQDFRKDYEGILRHVKSSSSCDFEVVERIRHKFDIGNSCPSISPTLSPKIEVSEDDGEGEL